MGLLGVRTPMAHFHSSRKLLILLVAGVGLEPTTLEL